MGRRCSTHFIPHQEEHAKHFGQKNSLGNWITRMYGLFPDGRMIPADNLVRREAYTRPGRDEHRVIQFPRRPFFHKTFFP